MYEQYTDKQIVEMLVPKLKKCTAQIDWDVVTSEPDSLWGQMFWGDILKAISIAYRSAYIRGQLGRSFIIGEKMKRASDTVFQVGDGVKLISRKDIDNESNRYFPPLGTTGKVVELGSDYCFVQWSKGVTADNGVWACPNHFLKKVTEHWVPATRDNVKVGSKVRMIDEKAHASSPDCYPSVGTVGVVIDNNICRILPLIQWPRDSVGNDDVTHCLSRYLEVLLCE